MYRHLLLPTDGSELARRAVEHGIRLAQSLGARLTALHVTPRFRPSELHAHAILREAQQDELRSRADAHRILDPVARAAHAAGVACELVHKVGDKPWQTIIEVAAERGCDLVCIGSHGRSGVRALVLGGQTTKLLTHSKLAVLVWR
jgi:nucleotide-binding universal stress UspA family protein